MIEPLGWCGTCQILVPFLLGPIFFCIKSHRRVRTLRSVVLEQGEAITFHLEGHELKLARLILGLEDRLFFTKASLDRALLEGWAATDIRHAIIEGEAAGLEEDELKLARVLLHVQEQKSKIHDAWHEPTLALPRRLRALDSAIAEGERADLNPQALMDSRDVVSQVKRRIAAYSRLQDALNVGAMDALEEALTEGRAAGLLVKEMEAADSDLQWQKRVLAARGAIIDAIQSKEVAALRSALAEGEIVSLNESEMRTARVVLAQEERKSLARESLFACVEEAESTGRLGRQLIDTMVSAIAEGKSAGLDENELRGPQRMLDLLQSS